MPLSKEQFQKARDAGFSVDQIVGFEKRRESGVSSLPQPSELAIPEQGNVQKQNILGSIFNVPGATSRAAIRANPILSLAGPFAGTAAVSGIGGEKAKQAAYGGALQPDKVESFQMQAIKKAQTSTNPLLNAYYGMPASAAGLAADILTSPADVLGMVLGKSPIGKKIPGGGNAAQSRENLAQAVSKTKPAQAIGRFLNKERTLLNPMATKVDNIIDYGINKALRPSVVGKNTIGQLETSKDRGREAIKTIVENKQSLEFVDIDGNVVAGKVPESLNQAGQGVRQTKKAIWQQIDDMVKGTTDAGVKIKTDQLVNNLLKKSNDKNLRVTSPGAAKRAGDLAEEYKNIGDLSPADIESQIESLNVQLKSFYKNPSYADAQPAKIMADLADDLRGLLDDSVKNFTGKEFQVLKNKYGALRELEEQIVKRTIVDGRKSIKGFFDLTDIFSDAQVARGLLTLNPGDVAQGVTQKALLNYFKKINSPDSIIKDMFRKVDRLHVPRDINAQPKLNPTIKKDSGKMLKKSFDFIDITSRAKDKNIKNWISVIESYPDKNKAYAISKLPISDTMKGRLVYHFGLNK